MNNLFRQIVEISLTCSLIILAIGLCSKLTLKKYSVKWQYLIWLVLTIRLIIPITPHWISVPIPNFETYISNKSQEEVTPTVTTKTLTKETVENSTFSPLEKISTNSKTEVIQSQIENQNKEDTISSTKVNHPIIPFDQLLTYVWLIGFILYFSYHFISYFAFLRKIKRWQIHNTDSLAQQTLIKLCEEFKISKRIPLSTCKDITSPMMVGFFHPQIILPPNQYTEHQLNAILKHELVHYKKYDLYYKLILFIANSIHWFNPFVYFMVNAANHSIEMTCDEAVIKNESLSFRQDYSMTILQILQTAKEGKSISFSTYFIGSKKQLKHRFQNIMNVTNKNKKGISIFILFALLTILTGNLTACGVETNLTSNNPIKNKNRRK